MPSFEVNSSSTEQKDSLRTDQFIIPLNKCGFDCFNYPTKWTPGNYTIESSIALREQERFGKKLKPGFGETPQNNLHNSGFYKMHHDSGIEICYRFFPVKMSVDDAAETCKLHNAHLPVIRSTAEYNMIQSIKPSPSNSIWIGIKFVNGHWIEKALQLPIIFSDFFESSTDENYTNAVLRNHRWHSVSTTHRSSFVCITNPVGDENLHFEENVPSYFKNYFKAFTTQNITNSSESFLSTQNDLLWDGKFKPLDSLDTFIPNMDTAMTFVSKNFLFYFEERVGHCQLSKF